ncbi:hypothetical protein BDZ89DRAFT_1078061, partial [Hymenopellis radicata]
INCPQCGLNPSICIDRTPRFDALTASNEPPLESERPELQQKLTRSREHSANLDIRITLLQSTNTLSRQRPSSPSRTLPTDVPGRVFPPSC